MGKAILFYRCRLCQKVVEIPKETKTVFAELAAALGHYYKGVGGGVTPAKAIVHSNCTATKNGFGVCDIAGGQDES